MIQSIEVDAKYYIKLKILELKEDYTLDGDTLNFNPIEAERIALELLGLCFDFDIDKFFLRLDDSISRLPLNGKNSTLDWDKFLNKYYSHLVEFLHY